MREYTGELIIADKRFTQSQPPGARLPALPRPSLTASRLVDALCRRHGARGHTRDDRRTRACVFLWRL